MDALSFPMVWLTTFLLPRTIVATWNEKNAAVYFLLVLMMGGALIGVFVALDLFMFYVFWELTLIPMFFLILKWGGTIESTLLRSSSSTPSRHRSSCSWVWSPSTSPAREPLVRWCWTGRTFDIPTLTAHAQAANAGGAWFLGESLQKILFVMLMIGFLVKLFLSAFPHLVASTLTSKPPPVVQCCWPVSC